MQKYKSLISILIVDLTLSGCMNTSNPQLNTLETDTSYIVCNDGCKNEWERAHIWIKKHSKFKIRISNEMMILTHGPKPYSNDYGFSVLKEPLDNNRYKINMAIIFDNRLLTLGGTPSHQEVKNLFYNYVKNGKDLLDNISDKTSLSVQ